MNESKAIITSPFLKATYKNRMAHYCAAPDNSAYRHLYDVAMALLAVREIEDMGGLYPTVEARNKAQRHLDMLNYCFVQMAELQRSVNDLHKRFHRMGSSHEKTKARSPMEAALVRRIEELAQQMPPLIHTLLQVAFHHINRTDLRRISIGEDIVTMARGDKLPYKVDDTQ